ncbi:MAG: DUF1501 domain-containing protein [Rubrivivax sp.]|nr:MAG: DUF1501 domain-containing protein [Rubrivivax sp.]
MTSTDLKRRAFLRQSGTLGAAGLIAPWAMNLAAMANAAAAGEVSDYKALVCVFLQGGNDQANTLIPVDLAGHATYASLRGQLALPLPGLAATTLAPKLGMAQDQQLALAPALALLKPLFDNQRLAALLNIGPLTQVTTKQQFLDAFLGAGGSAVLPPKLFSHNDQQSVWQSYGAEGEVRGWGGLIGDNFHASRNASSALTCVNLAGNTVYLAGGTVGQFMVNPKGPAPLAALNGSALFDSEGCAQAFKSLATTQLPNAHRMSKEHAKIMSRAIQTSESLRQALEGVPLPPIFDAGGVAQSGLASNPLAVQLNTAARIMAVRDDAAVKVKRQVFFVALGGFDHHDNLIDDHPRKLRQVAEALSQFDQDLGTLGLRDQVTTFTASDFGRTMSSNGNGSDHGWGSHHFVLGGAVNGGRYFGQLPDVGRDSQGRDTGDHNVGQGRLLPTMAVDQLAEALAKWMGVTDAASLDLIAPHRRQAWPHSLSTLFKA